MKQFSSLNFSVPEDAKNERENPACHISPVRWKAGRRAGAKMRDVAAV
jgi:hypothetical protein